MDSVVLEAQTRDKSLKARDLLRASKIPAVYYGKGVENLSIQMDYNVFRKVYRTAGSNTILELNLDGKDKLNVLVNEVQYDPVTDMITHVDFINVRMDQAIYTHVPITLKGLAPAVKDLGGILTHNLHEAEIKCLPKDLIHKIEVDVSGLIEFNVYIRVKDLVVPETVQILNSPEDIVATVVPPKIEEELTTVVTEAVAAPEAGSATEIKEETAQTQQTAKKE